MEEVIKNNTNSVLRYLVLFMALFAFNDAAMAQDVQVISSCSAAAKLAADQGAEYKPGVDVHGKAVTSANLNNEIKALSYPIEIPIEVNLIEFLDLELPDAARGAVELDPNVAFLSVHEDGRIEYNGQDVSSKVSYSCEEEGQDDVSDLLSHEEKIVEDPDKVITKEVLPAQSNGQSALDSVTSGEKIEGQSP